MAFSPRRRKNNPFLELRIQAVSSTIIILLLLSSSVSLSSSQQEQPPLSIHDLLKTRGLPAGLLPKDVKNYTLSETGLLEVHLEGPCLTKFDTMAFYESVVRGNLSYGGLTGVEGFSQEELFLWLPVKDIIVDDPNSGLILFDIGLAYKQLSFSLFDDPPDCKESSAPAQEDLQILHGCFREGCWKRRRICSSKEITDVAVHHGNGSSFSVSFVFIFVIVEWTMYI